MMSSWLDGPGGRHDANASEVSAYTLESSEHPLMVGQSGEAYARLAIESDGSMLFGTGANAKTISKFSKRKGSIVPQRLKQIVSNYRRRGVRHYTAAVCSDQNTGRKRESVCFWNTNWFPLLRRAGSGR